jgi:glutathione peroxidase
VSNLIKNPQPQKMVFKKPVKRSSTLLLVLLAVSVRLGFAFQIKTPSGTPVTQTPQVAQPNRPKQSGPGGNRRRNAGANTTGEADAKPEKNAYDYYLPGSDGKNIPLSNFKGKYIIIVNLGRKSSYNDQLPALIKLNDTYKGRGLVVIGIPSNDFGAAEPGTGSEIQKAYADAKVDFLVTGISKLASDDELPFFLYLTKSKNAPAGGPIPWNYTKFIVDKKGSVIARLDSDVAPDSPEMLSTIDQILDGTYKPKKEGGKPGATPATSSDPD